MRPQGAAFEFGFIIIALFRASVSAEDRMTFAPAVSVGTVHDDNLFFSTTGAARDVIMRVTPSFETQFASPRLSVGGNYAFDADRYTTHSSLTNRFARQRAAADVSYRVDPRLTLAFGSTYTATDTPSELNILTGLGTARLQARRFELTPSARFLVSPRVTLRASLSSSHDSLGDGSHLRSQFLDAGLDRRMTLRDAVKVDAEIGRYAFNSPTNATATDTYVLRGGWNHQFSPTTQLTLNAGPRWTEGSVAPELAVSITRRASAGSISFSAFETQTTAIGIGRPLDVRGVNAMVIYSPLQQFSAYAAPAILRSSRSDLQTTVYRIAFGGRYEITPFATFDLSYSRDSQRGTLNPVLSTGILSRSVLSLGLRTHWNMNETR